MDNFVNSNFMDLSNDQELLTVEIPNEKILDRPPKYLGSVGDFRSIKELPNKYQSIFEFPLFNVIQSKVLDDALYSDNTLVVSAPTGSGKTAIFELGIIRLLMKLEEENYSGDYKMVYVAPVKALCSERLIDWHSKFSKIGITSIIVTGDSDIVDWRNLNSYRIILTTPEKWDALTRGSKDNTNIIADVKLFMIDEVHLLNEEARGPILEAIVSRMKILQKPGQIRFMAVSATIPNVEDISEWLGGEEGIYFKIGEDFRPVKLKKIVLGYPYQSNSSSFKFDLSLNYKLQSVIMQYAEGKPTLIFCSTRKGVEMTSKHIAEQITFRLNPQQNAALKEAAQSMVDSKMKFQLTNGIGSHHAGMSMANRHTIETLFRSGNLPVLVTTSTLAMGVNLPAHLVIIKSTQHYVGGQFQDYSETSLFQMIGRAGRPQFDTSATVVIMAKSTEKEKYERMLGGTELIESNLHRHLTEHINAEVVLQIITDIAVALNWLRSTFLYVRVLKNPKHYNLPTNFTKDKIEKKLQDLCQIEINALNRHGMLKIDNTDGFSLYPTSIGSIMAKYYLAFNTVKLFQQVKGNESLSEMLDVISKCNEFSETVVLRVNDKKTLNTLNKCRNQMTIRFPLTGNIKNTEMKVNCMIQANFGCLKILNASLIQESMKIMRFGERISKCLTEYLLKKEKCFEATLNALTLNKCFHAKLWENSNYICRQLPKIGPVISSMLVNAGKTTFKSLLETSPRDIERIINRAPPMGNDIQYAVSHLPNYKLNICPSEDVDFIRIQVTVTLLNPALLKTQCTVGLNSYMTLLVGDSENNLLLYKKLQHNSMVSNVEYSQNVKLITERNHLVKAYLISDNWVGIDCHEKVEIIIDNPNNTQSISIVSTENKSNPVPNHPTVPKKPPKSTKTPSTKPNNHHVNNLLSYLINNKPDNKETSTTTKKSTKNDTKPGTTSKLIKTINTEINPQSNNNTTIRSNCIYDKILLNTKPQQVKLNQNTENINKLQTYEENNSNLNTISKQNQFIPPTESISLLEQTSTTSESRTVAGKPPFPKTFKEYVQDDLAKLKKDILVNDAFDFDIGMEELIMSCFDESSESSGNEVQNNQDKIKQLQNDINQNCNESNYEIIEVIDDKLERESSELEPIVIDCDKNTLNPDETDSMCNEETFEVPNNNMEIYGKIDDDIIEIISYSSEIDNTVADINLDKTISDQNPKLTTVDSVKTVDFSNDLSFISPAPIQSSVEENIDFETRYKKYRDLLSNNRPVHPINNIHTILPRTESLKFPSSRPDIFEKTMPKSYINMLQSSSNYNDVSPAKKSRPSYEEFKHSNFDRAGNTVNKISEKPYLNIFNSENSRNNVVNPNFTSSLQHEDIFRPTTSRYLENYPNPGNNSTRNTEETEISVSVHSLSKNRQLLNQSIQEVKENRVNSKDKDGLKLIPCPNSPEIVYMPYFRNFF